MSHAHGTIRVGTRGSLLARTQTEWVLERLRAAHPELQTETVVIRTAGDVRSATAGPARLGGKGFFTKEIEDALRDGTVDLAVHSLKDLPVACPPGLTLGALPTREDPRDALVGLSGERLQAAAGSVRIGTSSLRRAAQLRRAFPGCTVVDLRGNLDTRLQKVRDGVVDGAVLAAAGLHRLGRQGEIADYFTLEQMLPAPGQGALAIEIRADDAGLRELLAPLHCFRTAAAVEAERAFLQALGGGCSLPVAALATVTEDTVQLRGRVLSLDGACCLDAQAEGPAGTAGDVGRSAAATLLARGAADILRRVSGGPEGSAGPP
jgi:hydroxymethylbilane synthase